MLVTKEIQGTGTAESTPLLRRENAINCEDTICQVTPAIVVSSVRGSI
jgi:hypothetical protein